MADPSPEETPEQPIDVLQDQWKFSSIFSKMQTRLLQIARDAKKDVKPGMNFSATD